MTDRPASTAVEDAPAEDRATQDTPSAAGFGSDGAPAEHDAPAQETGGERATAERDAPEGRRDGSPDAPAGSDAPDRPGAGGADAPASADAPYPAGMADAINPWADFSWTGQGSGKWGEPTTGSVTGEDYHKARDHARDHS